MKRKLKWIAVVLVVLLLGFGTVLFLWPRDRITVESWKQLRVGMSQKEVEDILSGPGISYTEFRAHVDTLEELGKPPQPDGRQFFEPDVFLPRGSIKAALYWIGRRGCIYIEFDEADRVLLKAFYGWCPVDPNFLDRLRDWLGW